MPRPVSSTSIRTTIVLTNAGWSWRWRFCCRSLSPAGAGAGIASVGAAVISVVEAGSVDGRAGNSSRVRRVTRPPEGVNLVA